MTLEGPYLLLLWIVMIVGVFSLCMVMFWIAVLIEMRREKE